MLTITRILISKFFELARKEEGVTAIEYGLIAALIAVAIIAALLLVQGSLQNIFTEVSTQMDNA